MTSVHTLSLIHIYGQTDWNLAGKIQGKTDVPLNEEGRAQARFLADAMKSRPAAKVFTSPLKRARETAQAVAEALEAPLLLVPEFEEVDFGLWEGLSLIHICAPWGRTSWRPPGRSI